MCNIKGCFLVSNISKEFFFSKFFFGCGCFDELEDVIGLVYLREEDWLKIVFVLMVGFSIKGFVG